MIIREENQNLIGEAGLNDNLMNDKFFNVHNGVSLAGYGYFPPLIYQAYTTHVDVEKNPLTGMQLPRDRDRDYLRRTMYCLLFVVALMVLTF